MITTRTLLLSECRFDGAVETMTLENLIRQAVQRRGPPQLMMCPCRKKAHYMMSLMCLRDNIQFNEAGQEIVF